MRRWSSSCVVPVLALLFCCSPGRADTEEGNPNITDAVEGPLRAYLEAELARLTFLTCDCARSDDCESILPTVDEAVDCAEEPVNSWPTAQDMFECLAPISEENLRCTTEVHPCDQGACTTAALEAMADADCPEPPEEFAEAFAPCIGAEFPD